MRGQWTGVYCAVIPIKSKTEESFDYTQDRSRSFALLRRTVERGMVIGRRK